VQPQIIFRRLAKVLAGVDGCSVRRQHSMRCSPCCAVLTSLHWSVVCFTHLIELMLPMVPSDSKLLNQLIKRDLARITQFLGCYCALIAPSSPVISRAFATDVSVSHQERTTRSKGTLVRSITFTITSNFRQKRDVTFR
jgi:hypothetical protein